MLIPKNVTNIAIALVKIVGLRTADTSPITVNPKEPIISAFLPKRSPINADTINPITCPRYIMKIRKLSSFA